MMLDYSHTHTLAKLTCCSLFVAAPPLEHSRKGREDDVAGHGRDATVIGGRTERAVPLIEQAHPAIVRRQRAHAGVGGSTLRHHHVVRPAPT